MYITVLKMTRDSILQAENLLDIYSSNSIHQWLTKQQNTSRVKGQLLYKILFQKDEIYFYIQSKNKFNLNNLNDVGFVFIKEFEIISILNDYYSFDVQVFPCITVNDKRYFIKDINKRYRWLQEQFDKFGIVLLDCIEYNRSDIILDKDHIKNVPTASYKGTFYIKDINLATQLFENGLGRFKNYGLGLILFKNFSKN